MNDKGYSTVANTRVLNTKAFYGANSSGKSNVFKAVAMMKGLIIHSVRLNDNETLPYDAFLLSDNEARPTRFEMSFVDGTDKFVYGFSYTAQRIEEEWLFAKFPKRSLKILLRRTSDLIEIDAQNYSEGLAIKEGTIPLNNNRLFISLAAQLGGEISKRVIEWFRTRLNVISGLRDNGFSRKTKEMLHTKTDYKDDILGFISSMDVGFREVTTEQELIDEKMLPKGLPAEIVASLKEHPTIVAYAKHYKINANGEVVGMVDFDIDERESDGTRKLFNLAGLIVDTLRYGKSLFVDELDAQLHPLLSRRIVQLFNNTETNPCGAQLIFTTHDTNMLSKKLLRRDQVVFVEKTVNTKYSTKLTPMMSITLDNGAKPRTDSNYEKNYLEGKYGAIPYFEDDFYW
ncbi:MAG: ATP-binding protein [Bacteroidaceae bacterium]|nr:ATP-binding protein [Bacteroidaceae bacterium]